MAERLDSIAAERDYVTLVAERSGFVVGVAGVRVGPLYEKTGRYGQLMLLAVTESAQGTGVGRALMAAVEELVRERGGIEMVVHSGDQRPAAHTFYRRAGYRDTGRRFIKPLVPARA